MANATAADHDWPSLRTQYDAEQRNIWNQFFDEQGCTASALLAKRELIRKEQATLASCRAEAIASAAADADAANVEAAAEADADAVARRPDGFLSGAFCSNPRRHE